MTATLELGPQMPLASAFRNSTKMENVQRNARFENMSLAFFADFRVACRIKEIEPGPWCSRMIAAPRASCRLNLRESGR